MGATHVRIRRVLAALALALSSVAAVGSDSHHLAFRAAGVMPYAMVDGSVHFLVGGEYRADCFDDGPGFCWSTFVGRRHPPEDHPSQTAVREFHEETRFAFSISDGAVLGPKRLSGLTPLPTHKTGIYVYLLQVPYLSPEDISDRQSGRVTEKKDYCWVTLPQLLEAVDSPPHSLPPQCGPSDQRLFHVFRKDMTGDSEIRSSIEALAAK